MNIVIRNNTNEIKNWVKEFQPNEVFNIPTDNSLYQSYANCNDLLTAITNGEASVGNGIEYYAAISDQINHLKQLISEVKVTEISAFAAKTVGTKKLFKRVNGIQSDVNTGDNILLFTIPYNWAKITGIELINGSALDRVNFFVLDSISGTYSTVPNYTFNQFALNVNVSKDYYEHKSEFDADLYIGMQIKVIYNSVDQKKIGINFILNEVK